MLGAIRSLFDRRPGAGGACRVALFGKHPGWDDHIDDQNVETEGLVEAKGAIYAEGIGGNIDSGTWQSLPEASRLESFAHTLVWDRRRSLIVARVWSSRDRKGRAAYPLIACAEGPAGSSAAAESVLLPLLLRLEERCRATTDAAGVIEAVAWSQGEAARLSLPGAEPDREAEAVGGLVAHFGEEAVVRVAYHLEREAGTLLRPVAGERSRQGSVTDSAHARVPATDDPDGGAGAWRTFLRLQARGGVPIMSVRGPEGGYLDLVLGRPGQSTLFCLRAGQAVIPLTTDVPYEVSSSARQRVMRT